MLQQVCQTWPFKLWVSYPTMSLLIQRTFALIMYTTMIGLLILNCGGAYYLQEGFIVIRRTCTCDLMRIVSRVPSSELISVALTPALQNRLSYVGCRAVCACLP